MNEPKHIAIILDGNRRWAKAKGLMPWKGHEKGAETFREILQWCKDLGIQELTAYTFSMQNFGRAEDEKRFLFKLFQKEFKALLSEKNLKKAKEEGVSIRFLGRTELFPKEMQETMHKIMEKTKENKPKKVNLCMGYGGREEITDASKKIARDVKEGRLKLEEINTELVGRYMYMNSEPDIIIRTGGTNRTSNFLNWQGYYSEWFFIDKMLPELTKEDLVKIIEEFKTRERRYGK